MEFRYQSTLTNETHVVRIYERTDGFEVCIEERCYHVQAHEINPSRLDMWLDGFYWRTYHAAEGDKRAVALNDKVYDLTRVRQRRKRRAAGEGEDTLKATMPGQIVAVLVSAGEVVERGQTLVLMEAMKMELRVVAPHGGSVSHVFVTPGETVERGQTLVELALDEQSS